MRTLTISRVFDGTDGNKYVYKWLPTNLELLDKAYVRELFDSEADAIAFDETAKEMLLFCINSNSEIVENWGEYE